MRAAVGAVVVAKVGPGVVVPLEDLQLFIPVLFWAHGLVSAIGVWGGSGVTGDGTLGGSME